MPLTRRALGNSIAIVLALAFSVVSCATVGGMRSAPLTAGMSRTFNHEYDAVLRAAREAVVDAGFTIEVASEVKPKTWMIIGTKGASAWSWGELVRVVVDEAGPDSTTVRIHTKRKLATNVTAKGDYSTSIFSIIELNLK